MCHKTNQAYATISLCLNYIRGQHMPGLRRKEGAGRPCAASLEGVCVRSQASGISLDRYLLIIRRKQKTRAAGAGEDGGCANKPHAAHYRDIHSYTIDMYLPSDFCVRNLLDICAYSPYINA